ncbi:nuclear transport factor 2 family protein [Bradyrhizobium ottawaense]|uniref:nuclear transport factor 2 family protein n=1 Tax=Bradyrhizobium ottawaense TaxID=931866 RepID=UPI001454E6F7|nr:nuclear transport factor 2 family protein [Bradyrhizobium ottawaense]
MAVVSLQNLRYRNPRTVEEASAMVGYVQSLFNLWNVDALVAGFTPNCVIRFCDLPEFSGRELLRKLFISRSQHQKNYVHIKTFRSLMNDTISNTWESQWQDALTGQTMTGFGCEVWLLRNGKIAVWEGAFNASPVSWRAGADEF